MLSTTNTEIRSTIIASMTTTNIARSASSDGNIRFFTKQTITQSTTISSKSTVFMRWLSQLDKKLSITVIMSSISSS